MNKIIFDLILLDSKKLCVKGYTFEICESQSFLLISSSCICQNEFLSSKLIKHLLKHLRLPLVLNWTGKHKPRYLNFFKHYSFLDEEHQQLVHEVVVPVQIQFKSGFVFFYYKGNPRIVFLSPCDHFKVNEFTEIQFLKLGHHPPEILVESQSFLVCFYQLSLV